MGSPKSIMDVAPGVRVCMWGAWVAGRMGREACRQAPRQTSGNGLWVHKNAPTAGHTVGAMAEGGIEMLEVLRAAVTAAAAAVLVVFIVAGAALALLRGWLGRLPVGLRVPCSVCGMYVWKGLFRRIWCRALCVECTCGRGFSEEFGDRFAWSNWFAWSNRSYRAGSGSERQRPRQQPLGRRQTVGRHHGRAVCRRAAAARA
eukprot:360249-Chlamydomonas_euryale.AAC.3